RIRERCSIGAYFQPVNNLLGPLNLPNPGERLGEVTSERDDVRVAQPFGFACCPGALQVLDGSSQVATAECTQPECRRAVDSQAAHATWLDVPAGPFHMRLAPFTVTSGCLDPGQQR